MQWARSPVMRQNGPAMASAAPIEGITYWISLKTAVTVSMELDGKISSNGTVKLKGSIAPPTGKQEKLRLELYDGTGKLLSSTQIAADKKGGFSAKFNSLGHGQYSARAFLDNSTAAASATSNSVAFDV